MGGTLFTYTGRPNALLEKCEGNAHPPATDLYDQWTYLQKTTQWRYTPPTHVVAALDEAIGVTRTAPARAVGTPATA